MREYFETVFQQVVMDLDLTSTVGLTSLRLYGSTVGEFFKGSPFEGTADPERVELLKQSVWQRLNNPNQSDPIRVFVKPEPHKRSKLAEGRLRLISAVSLVDAVCDRIMFSWLVKKSLRTIGFNSCAVGLPPFRGGHRWYWEVFRDKKTRALDMTAWDWAVPGWLLKALRDLVKDFAVCAPAYWSEWVDARWETLFRDAVFGFADGTTVKQPGWGVMKSGCYLTLLLNTLGQIFRHFMVLETIGVDRPLSFVCCGDDQTIEDFPEFHQYEAVTRRLGFLLKDSVVSSGAVHFIGFVMYADGFEPEYKEKHGYILSHTPEDKLPALLQSYQYLYAYVPKWFNCIRIYLSKRSPSLVISSREAKDVMQLHR